jgi:hypothetical protein
MRRNLTISFDAAWIELLDQRRGKQSRGVFLEALMLDPTPRSEKPGVPEVQRSPSLSEQIKASDHLAYGGPKQPGPLSKPPLQRPIVQKR